MGLILNKVALENFNERNIIYSKTVRGQLPFIIETHHLDGGKNLQIFLYRDHPRIKEFIEKAQNKNYLTTQKCQLELGESVLRLYINDKDFMINPGGKTTIDIVEYNFNTKDINLVDFPKGKVAILINLFFEKEIDNLKLRTELKNNNMEDSNYETTSITSN